MSARGSGNGASLSRAERFSLSVTRFLNEQPLAKRAQRAWLLGVHQFWCRYAIGRRVYADNVESLIDPPSDRGVVLCLNHRTYFDAYITMWALYESGARWPDKIYFPVRSNFFYENPAGVALNVVFGGGTLYPPIFRDAARADLNKDALQRMARFLEAPGALVGLHPEGTRGKGPDPYQLLPAQPGVGNIVKAHPVVLPVFINGLSNKPTDDIASNWRRDIRRDNPVIIVFGEPLDYADLAAQKPRAALYKKTSDRIRDAIIELGVRERELREACLRGDISDDAPGWMMPPSGFRLRTPRRA